MRILIILIILYGCHQERNGVLNLQVFPLEFNPDLFKELGLKIEKGDEDYGPFYIRGKNIKVVFKGFELIGDFESYIHDPERNLSVYTEIDELSHSKYYLTRLRVKASKKSINDFKKRFSPYKIGRLDNRDVYIFSDKNVKVYFLYGNTIKFQSIH
jgi:ribosomal protein L31